MISEITVINHEHNSEILLIDPEPNKENYDIFSMKRLKYYLEKKNRSSDDNFILAHFYLSLGEFDDFAINLLGNTSVLSIACNPRNRKLKDRLSVLEHYREKYEKILPTMKRQLLVRSKLAIIYSKIANLTELLDDDRSKFQEINKLVNRSIELGNNQGYTLLGAMYRIYSDYHEVPFEIYSKKCFELAKKAYNNKSLINLRFHMSFFNTSNPKNPYVRYILSLYGAERQKKEFIKYADELLQYTPNNADLLLVSARLSKNKEYQFKVYHYFAHPHLYKNSLYPMSIYELPGIYKIPVACDIHAVAIYYLITLYVNNGIAQNLDIIQKLFNTLDGIQHDLDISLYSGKYYWNIGDVDRALYHLVKVKNPCADAIRVVTNMLFDKNRPVEAFEYLIVHRNSPSVNLIDTFNEHRIRWSVKFHIYLELNIDRHIIYLLLICKNRRESVQDLRFFNRMVVMNIIPHLIEYK